MTLDEWLEREQLKRRIRCRYFIDGKSYAAVLDTLTGLLIAGDMVRQCGLGR